MPSRSLLATRRGHLVSQPARRVLLHEAQSWGILMDSIDDDAWESYRIHELYGDTPRLDAKVPPTRQARAFRLRDVEARALALDDRLDRETLSVQRTRDSLRAVPFYARRAEQAGAEGDEWSYWRSVASHAYRYSPEEFKALLESRARHDEFARQHAPKALADMAGKTLVLPPLGLLVGECNRRFGCNMTDVPSAARATGRERELSEILLRAIESGAEPDIYGFLEGAAGLDRMRRGDASPARP